MTRHLLIPPDLAVTPEPISPKALASLDDLPGRFPGAGLRRVACIEAPWLARLADPSGSTTVALALEHLQCTGSFKFRGALCAVDALHHAGVRRVVAASAGNHGIGVARAARLLGTRATIVVPAAAPSSKTARIEREGAAIERVEGGYDAAEARALELASEQGACFLSPYDDDFVLAGNGGSLGLEICAALRTVPDRVIVPIGGGGLATGMAWAMATAASQSVPRPVWTVQSEASAAFALSVTAGRAQERLETTIPTLADGLEGGISARAFARAASTVAGVSVVSEADISAAMRSLRDRLGLMVEGSAATGVALAMQGFPPHLCGGRTVIALTGRNAKQTGFDPRPG